MIFILSLASVSMKNIMGKVTKMNQDLLLSSKRVFIYFTLDVRQYLKGCPTLDTAQGLCGLNISESYS